MSVQAFEALIRSGASALRVLRRKRCKTGRLLCHACASRTVYRSHSGPLSVRALPVYTYRPAGNAKVPNRPMRRRWGAARWIRSW